MNRRRTFLIVVLFAAGVRVQAQGLVTFSGATMGTRYAVTLGEREYHAALQKQVDARLAEINGRMSTYDQNSELSRFNQYRGDDWFPVSNDTAQVVKFALEVAKITDGAFDPTVGPAVNLWGFGPAGRRKKPPTDVEVAEALKRIGYSRLEVRQDPPALRKAQADLYLDLSAVAKGYAVDEVADLLARNGSRDSLVVIGGEIRVSGRKPDGSHWRIGIEEPDTEGRVLERKVQIENAAIGTSGDWQNSFNHEGERYSHVIEPRTGRPVRHNVAGVTVIADRAMQTDAWATALLVMGAEQGAKWCEQHQVAALFFVRNSDGTVVVDETSQVSTRLRN